MRPVARVTAAALLLACAGVAVAAEEPRPSGTAIEVSRSALPAAAAVPAGPPAPQRSGAPPDIEVAYRAFAGGELAAADRMLSDLVERQPSPAAFLLRGCTRYTRAMLSRDRDALLDAARADIRRAYALNPSLWLDPARFSPRLVAFADEVRRAQP